MPTTVTLDRARLASLDATEQARFVDAHPRSGELFERAKRSLLAGVPMNWMVKWPGPTRRSSSRPPAPISTCVDGHDYVDLCLGDTGAMAGHGAGRRRSRPSSARCRAASPTCSRPRTPRGSARSCPPVRPAVLAVRDDRHGRQPVLAPARPPDHRPAVHRGPRVQLPRRVDETFACSTTTGRVVARRGNIGPPVDPRAHDPGRRRSTTSTRLEAALADGQVAAVLIEPALTNVGIVLPEPGYLDARPRDHPPDRHDPDHRRDPHDLRRTGRHDRAPTGSTPTCSSSARRSAAASRSAAYGFTQEIADRITARRSRLEDSDVGGIGGTLAGYALSLAATRATLGEVLTDAAFARMIPLAERWDGRRERRHRQPRTCPGT